MTPMLDVLQAGDRVGVTKEFGDAWLQAYGMDALHTLILGQLPADNSEQHTIVTGQVEARLVALGSSK